jgi:hypothetical protein
MAADAPALVDDERVPQGRTSAGEANRGARELRYPSWRSAVKPIVALKPVADDFILVPDGTFAGQQS